MDLAKLFTTTTIPQEPGRRPRDSELDLFGLTHRGKVRAENQDHFLVSTVHQQVVVHGSSLPDPSGLPLRGERLGTLLLVADGVGSGAGEDASRLAMATITEYASDTMRCFHQAGRAGEQAFFEALKGAALRAHEAVRAEASTRTNIRSMATTLTLVLVVWPTMYVTQVGDSRCYLYQDDRLQRVTRDQTMAQDLVDKGVLPADEAARSPLSNVLASAIGGTEAMPDVRKVALHRGCVVLLCSDGLTKHVGDAEIEAVLRGMTSSEAAARTLVDRALDAGGTDNITVLVSRARWEAMPA